MTNKQIFALISAMCLSISAAGCGKKEKPAKDDIKTANATNVMVYEVGAERIENSVNLNDMALLLDQATILYARSEEDANRFEDCKNRMWQNLKNDSFVYKKALEYMDKALEIYRTMIFEEKLYRVRSEADCIHELLSRAVAVLNHTYTESAIYSENQAYNGEDENRMYFCPELKIVPDGFFANARKLLEAADVKILKETIFALLKTTRAFILERKPKNPTEKENAKIDFQNLADWYQELSLTWRRIRYFCKNNLELKEWKSQGWLLRMNCLTYLKEN